MTATTLFTIGYEAKTQAEFLDHLVFAGVLQVLDVRAVASSRRPGFAKTALFGGLRERGIAYLHLRPLGTPRAGREAARRGQTALMREIYAGQLATPEAELAFEELRVSAMETPSALLCFEREAPDCHRAVLAERLAATDGFKIINL